MEEQAGSGIYRAGKQVKNGGDTGKELVIDVEPERAVLRRFHGSVELDPMRLGRDAGRIADEVISHGCISGTVRTFELN